MKIIEDYKILEDEDNFTLTGEINNLIKCNGKGVEGIAFSGLLKDEYWQPQGGVVYSDKRGKYIQAMVGGK